MDLIKDASEEDAKCPIYRFTAICESKWSVLVLRELFRNEDRRFKDFKSKIPNITDRSLNETLKRLQALKLVERKVLDTSPPSVVYKLSNFGEKLLPVFKSLMEWGKTTGAQWWKDIKKV